MKILNKGPLVGEEEEEAKRQQIRDQKGASSIQAESRFLEAGARCNRSPNAIFIGARRTRTF